MDTSDLINIRKNLMKKYDWIIMFVFIKKTIIGLLTSLVNDSNYTKGVSLKYQQCMIQLHLINLFPNEYSQ